MPIYNNILNTLIKRIIYDKYSKYEENESKKIN